MRKIKATDEDLFNREMHLALSIPSLMVAGPIMGLGIAYGVIKWFHLGESGSNAALLIGLLVGLATAAREVYRIIRRISTAAERSERRSRAPRRPSADDPRLGP